MKLGTVIYRKRLRGPRRTRVARTWRPLIYLLASLIIFFFFLLYLHSNIDSGPDIGHAISQGIDKTVFLVSTRPDVILAFN